MTKSSGQHTLTPYKIIAQTTSRNSEPPNPSVNSPLPPDSETETIGVQSQPEQQAQIHESLEGQRRALQLIEEYANDINVDDYEFDDEFRIQQQPMQYARIDEDDLIISPQQGSDEANEQRQPQQQAQAIDRDTGKKQIQPHDLPDNDHKDDDGDEEITLHQQPEQQAQTIDSSSTC